MTKPKKLSYHDKVTLEKNFPLYAENKYINMLTFLFKQFHSEKKLDFALKYIDYRPFKDALKNHDYEFFNQLVEALPQERYKKLMLMYNKCELIELFLLSLDNYNSIDSDSIESILKVWNNINSLMPEEAEDLAKAHPKSKIIEIIFNEDSHEFVPALSKNDEIYQNLLGKKGRTNDTCDERELKKPEINNELEDNKHLSEIQVLSNQTTSADDVSLSGDST